MSDLVFVGFIVAGALFCGFIGDWIAKRRGDKEGFTISFLLGPIGWLLVLGRRDERRKCPQCLGAVPTAAQKCMHCGSALTDAAPAAQISEVSSDCPGQ